MGLFSNIFSPARSIQKANALDEYIMRQIANIAVLPDYSSGTYLESYTGNGDVFTVINKITEPGSIIPIYQYNEKDEINERGQMIQLLNNPNPFMDRSEFIEAFWTFFLIFGDAYMAYESVAGGLNAGKPLRLDVLPPQWVELVLGTYFNPVKGYKFTMSGNIMDYEYEQVLHWKEFNPDYDAQGTGHLKGMSRLKPLLKAAVGSSSAYDALVSAFQHHGAVGILTLLGEDSKPTNFSQTFLSKVKRQFKEEYSGAKKNGSIVVTDKAHQWTNMNLTTVELGILDAVGIFGGKLFDAYGVPSVLMAGSKDKTYMNYPEAMRALYQNAIVPGLDTLLAKLSRWLAPKFGEIGQVLKADYSQIPALQTNKAELIAWMVLSRSYTRNEIREAAGAERSPDPAMDKVYDSAGMVPLDELGLMPDSQLTEEVMKRLKLPDYRKK